MNDSVLVITIVVGRIEAGSVDMEVLVSTDVIVSLRVSVTGRVTVKASCV